MAYLIKFIFLGKNFIARRTDYFMAMTELQHTLLYYFLMAAPVIAAAGGLGRLLNDDTQAAYLLFFCSFSMWISLIVNPDGDWEHYRDRHYK